MSQRKKPKTDKSILGQIGFRLLTLMCLTEKTHKYMEDETGCHVIAIKTRTEFYYIYPDNVVLCCNRLK